MVMERAKVISDIFLVLANDPKPTESYTLTELTTEVNKKGHDLTPIQMLGYLIHLKKSDILTIDPIGREGEPHIHLSPSVIDGIEDQLIV